MAVTHLSANVTFQTVLVDKKKRGEDTEGLIVCERGRPPRTGVEYRFVCTIYSISRSRGRHAVKYQAQTQEHLFSCRAAAPLLVSRPATCQIK